MEESERLDKVKGCILGFAIGDALGAPLEFSRFEHKIEGYEHSPQKGLTAGQFTDDTQHLEIGLDSIIENKGNINLYDLSERLVKWYKSGNARSIGKTTEDAVKNLIEGMPYNQSGIDHINACGSSAIPRLLPYSLLSAISRYEHKIDSSQTKHILGITHAHKKVKTMGDVLNYFIQEIANGKNAKETADMIIFEDNFLNRNIRDKLKETCLLAESDVDSISVIQKIGCSGFVEDIMYSSIYSALKGKAFEEAMLIAANAKGDSDSRASITGALYGLDIGASKIPEYFKQGLERSSELEKKAEQLYLLRK